MSATILLSSIAALTVLLYLAAGCKPATRSNLAIENPEESPLKIESAYVEDIVLPPVGTKGMRPRLVKPKIVLRNNSDRAIAVYELEFKKAGSDSIFLVNTEAGLAPKETATIEANTLEKKTTSIFARFLSATKPPGDSGAWAVHVIVMRFNDGNVLTLHPMPIPPPEGSEEITPGTSGPINVKTTPKVAVIDPNQFVAPTAAPDSVPPPTKPKVVVVDPNQFIAPTVVPDSVPPHTNGAPVVGMSNIVGGIPGGVSGRIPGGVVGGLLRPGAGPVAPPPPPKPVKRAPLAGVSNIVGGIPGGVSGGVAGGVPGGVVGNLLSNVAPVAPPPPKPVKREPTP